MGTGSYPALHSESLPEPCSPFFLAWAHEFLKGYPERLDGARPGSPRWSLSCPVRDHRLKGPSLTRQVLSPVRFESSFRSESAIGLDSLPGFASTYFADSARLVHSSGSFRSRPEFPCQLRRQNFRSVERELC
jgi:hypothetical protein